MPDAPGSQGRSTSGPLAGHAASQIEGKPAALAPPPPSSRWRDAASDARVLDTLAALADCRILARSAGATSPTPRLRELLRSRLEQLASGSTLHVSSEECAPTSESRHGVENLLAIVPGKPVSGRRAIYLVAGFDAEAGPRESRHDGACAAAIEVLSVLSRESLHASLVLVFCDGGTRDSLGAAFRANAARQMHAFDIAAILCPGEINSPGRWGDEILQPDRVRVFGGGGAHPGAHPDTPGRQIARVIEEAARHDELPIKATLVARDQPRPPHPDAARFLDHGFPVAILHEPTSPSGEFSPPDARYVSRVACLLGAAAERLALAPSPPEGARLDFHTIRWRANSDPDLAGYEIVWRSTTAPTWEHARWVAHADRFIVPEDPSTHVFGVVAVARSGHRSPASLAGEMF